MAPYRDQEAKLAELDRRIVELESVFTNTFWERVAPVWGVSRSIDSDPNSLEVRYARIEKLGALIETIRDGRHAAPDLPHHIRKLGPEVSGLPALLIQLTRDKTLLPTFLLRANGVPICVEIHSDWPLKFACSYTTTVAPTFQMSLAPEGVLQDLMDAAGLFPEAEIGHADFDRTFVVRGNHGDLDALLPPAVQTQLLEISNISTPRVRVEEGLATIRHCYPSLDGSELVLRTLEVWHTTRSRTSLLNG